MQSEEEMSSINKLEEDLMKKGGIASFIYDEKTKTLKIRSNKCGSYNNPNVHSDALVSDIWIQVAQEKLVSTCICYGFEFEDSHKSWFNITNIKLMEKCIEEP